MESDRSLTSCEPWSQDGAVLVLTRPSCAAGTDVYYFGYAKQLHSCENSRESHILSRCLKLDLQYQSMDRHFSLKKSRCSGHPYYAIHYKTQTCPPLSILDTFACLHLQFQLIWAGSG